MGENIGVIVSSEIESYRFAVFLYSVNIINKMHIIGGSSLFNEFVSKITNFSQIRAYPRRTVIIGLLPMSHVIVHNIFSSTEVITDVIFTVNLGKVGVIDVIVIIVGHIGKTSVGEVRNITVFNII